MNSPDDISITITAGSEEVVARLRGWHGEKLDARHVERIHQTVDRALTVLNITANADA